MVYVKRLFVILLIIMLLTYNIGFCADTVVNFPTSTANNFYVHLHNILNNTSNISTLLDSYVSNMYTQLQNINTYSQYIYKYNNNFTLAENYIINDQKNAQDIFIYCLEKDEELKNIMKNNKDMQVYAWMNSDDPEGYVFILYSDRQSHNSYQSYPYSGVLQHNALTIPNNLSIPTRTIMFNVVATQVTYSHYFLYRKGSTNIIKTLNTTGTMNIPTIALGYRSDTLRSYLLNLYGYDPTITAINDNTKAIKESTDRILSEQSDTITDTGVSDTTTDSSPNLQNTFNTMSSAFTTRSTSTKSFTFTLPNGQSYNFSLANNLLTNMLSSYGNTFYAFYQAIFWCIFGGYVLFDFKRIINKFKGGDIDSVVSTSSPIDNVVKASLG